MISTLTTMLLILLSSVTAQDLQVQFPAANPIFTGDVSWNGQVASHPWVLYDQVGMSMYYYSDYNFGPYHIARARSSNGIDWATDPVDPVIGIGEFGEFDDTHVIYSSVVAMEGGGYHMLYTGWDSGVNLSVGYASSVDGVAWTKSTLNPVLAPTEGAWDSERVADACLFFYDDLFHAWYAGFTQISSVSIGHAQSHDGIVWTKTPEPVFVATGVSSDWDSDRVYAPYVLHDGRVFHMFYVGTRSNNSYRSIGHAMSVDGLNWFRDSQGAWITPETCDDWAPGSTSAPSVIRENDLFRIWFSGNLVGNSWGIGYAEVEYTDELGDVNLDGFLTVGDLVKLVRVILGENPIELPILEIFGDLNEDGELNIQDLTLLVQTLISNP